MAKHKKSSSTPKVIALFLIGFIGLTGVVLASKLATFNGDNNSKAAVLSESVAKFSVMSGDAIANQEGASVTTGQSKVWIGTGSSSDQSYLGMYFTGANIPANATVQSASIEFIADGGWISTGVSFFGDLSNKGPFSSTNSPSARTLTANKASYSDNVKWEAGKAYSYDVTEPVRELIGTGGKSSLTLIAKGTGSKYGRKFVYGNTTDKQPTLTVVFTSTTTTVPTPTVSPVITPKPTVVPVPTVSPTTRPTVMPGMTMTPTVSGGTSSSLPSGSNSMAMMAWSWSGKNAPNKNYDKCEDGTDVVAAHNQYYVVAYDGLKYPTWHPPVVTNPITGIGKCYFGHEHGTNPQGYLYWNELVQHFGKDLNGDGKISALVISAEGKITQGDRAGIPFGIANEHMDAYYNKEGRDSIFVRHEDHVGHKIEFVNNEADMQGNSTHVMAQLPGTVGVNIPYGSSSNYQPTGVVCTHLHKFHQGTHSGDAMRNNLHEVIFHSSCMSVNANNLHADTIYPNNKVLLTGMMTFGNPAAYQRFCLDNPPRDSAAATVCVDGKDSSGKCIISDPLISKLPGAVYSNTLGRNMVDRYCLANFDKLNPGVKYFNPYEIWQGDFRVKTAAGKMLAEHGRQWDVLDPIRFVDPNSATGFGYYSQECNGLLQIPGTTQKRTLNCDQGNVPWDSPKSNFRGLHRSTYFGRNRVSNAGGTEVWWTDPLGGNAVTTAFASGLKQKFSSVEADICRISVCSTMNDRAIQRRFNDGGRTVHAPN